jgi:transcriptional regulator with GAF, ATPase, and Fis domain
LFYRLSVFPGEIPPLRERREDIPKLALHFVSQSAQRLNRPAPRVSQAALSRLAARESPVQPAGTANQRLFTRDELKELERESIVQALHRTKGKVFGPGGAAELLGMKPTTLVSRLTALGIKQKKTAL